MAIWKKYLIGIISLLTITAAHAQDNTGMISGKVISIDGQAIEFATVLLKGTSYSS